MQSCSGSGLFSSTYFFKCCALILFLTYTICWNVKITPIVEFKSENYCFKKKRCNVWSAEKYTKHSSNTLQCLVYFSSDQTLGLRYIDRKYVLPFEEALPEPIYNPIMAMVFTFQLDNTVDRLKSKHCRHPITVMGVVDAFGLYCLGVSYTNCFNSTDQKAISVLAETTFKELLKKTKTNVSLCVSKIVKKLLNNKNSWLWYQSSSSQCVRAVNCSFQFLPNEKRHVLAFELEKSHFDQNRFEFAI